MLETTGLGQVGIYGGEAGKVTGSCSPCNKNTHREDKGEGGQYLLLKED